VVRESPAEGEVEPASAREAASGAALQSPGMPIGMIELLRTPHFWTMCLSTSMGFAASQAVIVSFVPMGRESGLSMLEATSLVSVLGGTAIAGGFLVSFIADRYDRIRLLAALFVVEALVNGALALDKSYPTCIAAAATLGICSGTVVATFYALLADRFGTTSFGTVRGTAFMLNGVLGMVSVRFAGEVFDRTGGYDTMFATFLITQLIAAGLMFSSKFVGRRDAAMSTA
jgi:predicted MFS family arabinose efflux permease